MVGRDRIEPNGGICVEAPPTFRVGVAFVPVKAQRPEDTLRQLVEIGVDDIVVLQPTKRAVAGVRDRLVERAERIAREACMQSRRVHLPDIRLGVDLAEIVTRVAVAIADPDAPPLGGDVSMLVVGPEGGFDPAEIPAGCPRASIGPVVLRAETAALVAGARLVALRETRGERQ